MDDILLAVKDHCVLCSIQVAFIQAVQPAGSGIAPEKGQQQALWVLPRMENHSADYLPSVFFNFFNAV